MNVEDLVRTTLQAEIIKALKAAPEAIEAMVKAAISKPVDPLSGRPDGYGSKIPYLEYIVGTEIRHALERAVVEELAGRKDEIKAVLKDRLSSDNIVDAFAKSIMHASAEEWRIKVVFGKDT